MHTTRRWLQQCMFTVPTCMCVRARVCVWKQFIARLRLKKEERYGTAECECEFIFAAPVIRHLGPAAARLTEPYDVNIAQQ